MPKRTYSRFSLLDARREPPNKRSRVNSPSTPQPSSDLSVVSAISEEQDDLPSDLATPLSTPPSSPPRDSESATTASSPKNASPQLYVARKPAFSFLRRTRTSTRQSEVDLTVSKPFRSASDPPRKKLRQLTIDLGQPGSITCAECGMNYAPSLPSDVALHTKHHAKTASVSQIPPQMTRSLDTMSVWTSSSGSDRILRISRRHEAYAKRFVERLLAIVEQDLGAVNIPSAQLWSILERENKKGNKTKHDRYCVFLYLKERNCTGVLLAERVFSARRVLAQRTAEPDSISSSPGLMVLSEDQDPAVLGVSRIWVSQAERRAGLAMKLLDVAQRSFMHLLVLEKNKIAFTQPTETGAKLARQWFGQHDGWHVYVD
jgi:N-acetyltransferase